MKHHILTTIATLSLLTACGGGDDNTPADKRKTTKRRQQNTLSRRPNGTKAMKPSVILAGHIMAKPLPQRKSIKD